MLPLPWGLVVPLKPLDRAKTRLSPFAADARADLALAFAADVVAAGLACPQVREVVVVTDDPVARRRLAGPGVRVVPEAPASGLNPALARGAALLRADDAGLGVAAVPADLPALRPDDLGAALLQVGAGGRGLVADAEGSGTTLLAAGPGVDLDPRYGAGSCHRHLASGAVALVAPPGLRRDVDTPDDLAAALRLGVGPRTAAVVAALTSPPDRPDAAG